MVYHGPLWRKSRALNFSLLGNKKEFSRGKKRTTPPGIHGSKRKRPSPYGTMLKEKQKIKYGYGWKNKQLKNKYIKLQTIPGDLGINILINSKLRLDNLLFRSGIFNTLRFARQRVSHGFFLVDNQKIDIPSYQVKIGQVISFREKKMKKVTNDKLIKNNLEQNIKPPSYISLDKQKLTVTLLRNPLPEELDQDINTYSVVEFYNKY